MSRLIVQISTQNHTYSKLESSSGIEYEKDGKESDRFSWAGASNNTQSISFGGRVLAQFSTSEHTYRKIENQNGEIQYFKGINESDRFSWAGASQHSETGQGEPETGDEPGFTPPTGRWQFSDETDDLEPDYISLYHEWKQYENGINIDNYPMFERIEEMNDLMDEQGDKYDSWNWGIRYQIEGEGGMMLTPSRLSTRDRDFQERDMLEEDFISRIDQLFALKADYQEVYVIDTVVTGKDYDPQ
jgi:hypothetical protein